MHEKPAPNSVAGVRRTAAAFLMRATLSFIYILHDTHLRILLSFSSKVAPAVKIYIVFVVIATEASTAMIGRVHVCCIKRTLEIYKLILSKLVKKCDFKKRMMGININLKR